MGIWSVGFLMIGIFRVVKSWMVRRSKDTIIHKNKFSLS